MMRGAFALIGATAALLLSIAVGHAQSPTTPDTSRWTPELLLRYRMVQGIALSPAGDQVAYVVAEALTEGEKSEFASQIWLASAEGRGNRQFTRGAASARSPAFSPDGRWLAFISGRSGPPQVWVLPTQGGEALQATTSGTGVAAFSWAPDGTSIAFLAADAKTEEEKTAEQEKRDVLLLERPEHGFTGRAPPKNRHLYIAAFAPDGEEQTMRRVTEGDFHVTSFDWAPDARQIVFAHQPDPTPNTGYLASDISLVDVASREVRQLVTGGGVDERPRFSPDGSRVAFVSSGERPEPVGLGDVYVVDATGGEPRKLAELSNRAPTGIIGWSAGGGSLYVAQVDRTEHHLFELPADGGAAHRITQDDGVFFYFSVSRDGSRLAFTYETPDTPHDIYITPTDRFATTRVTDLHRDLPRPALGRTELLEWRSNDGLPIEGLLTYPVGYRQGQRVPLIVDVHGGPSGVFLSTFEDGPAGFDGRSPQFFAHEGFAVLRPNPRGSTGYGKEFRHAVVGEWGHRDLEDIMSGVDHVIAMGVAHPDSLLLTGWSYGGYMTAFAVTRTDRFRAASMGAGISNLISMLTTHDIPDYMAAHIGGDPWDDYARWEKHSAIYGVGNVTTPTQVIHGQDDGRVPLAQALEFYNALRRRGVPTQMVVYPRTGHWPDEPKFVVDMSYRILEWFERHLGRSGRVAADGS